MSLLKGLSSSSRKTNNMENDDLTTELNDTTEAAYLDNVQPEEFEEYDDDYDHDDMYDTDSALGSAGFGTDEYYE